MWSITAPYFRFRCETPPPLFLMSFRNRLWRKSSEICTPRLKNTIYNENRKNYSFRSRPLLNQPVFCRTSLQLKLGFAPFLIAQRSTVLAPASLIAEVLDVFVAGTKVFLREKRYRSKFHVGKCDVGRLKLIMTTYWFKYCLEIHSKVR